MDRIGPFAPCKVCWTARRQGCANGCQRTRRGGVSQTLDDGARSSFKARNPNQLVYLPRPHRVKKPGGMVIGRGKVIHPIQFAKCRRMLLDFVPVVVVGGLRVSIPRDAPKRTNSVHGCQLLDVIRCNRSTGELRFSFFGN
jgi:hypothetical protein